MGRKNAGLKPPNGKVAGLPKRIYFGVGLYFDTKRMPFSGTFFVGAENESSGLTHMAWNLKIDSKIEDA